MTVVEQLGHQRWDDVRAWDYETLHRKSADHVELYLLIRQADQAEMVGKLFGGRR